MHDDHHDDEHDRRDERSHEDDDDRQDERCHDDDRERSDGRIRKGEVRNPYGRAGKPATRAQRERRRNEGMKEILLRELSREIEIMDRGKPEVITVRQFLAKKVLQDLAGAPVKQRLQLLCDARSPLRDVMEATPNDDDNDPWTEDLEAEYQAIAQRYVILEDRRDPYWPAHKQDRSRERSPGDGSDWPEDYMKGLDEPDEARAPERSRERDRDDDRRGEPRRR